MTERKPVGLWQLVYYFLHLGATGFGGPIALAGDMQRDLVHLGWITPQEYLEGLAFAQMMPGPLAAQLAMWIGYLRYGILGATLTGFVFVLPPFLIVLVVAALYVAYNGLAIVQALFYGIGPVVIAIVALSAVRLARATVGKDRPMWLIFAALMAITIFARTEIAVLFALGGVIGVLLYAPPWKWKSWAKAAPSILIHPSVIGVTVTMPLLAELGWFFIVAGAFTFGSGLAIVPFLHQGVVLDHHWLSERQFLDAVAVGIITPGPVVITAAFVGYLVAGFWGAGVSAAAVFMPVYVFVIFVGGFIIKHHEHPVLRGFVKGATAAASGAIAGAAVILGQGSIFDLPTALIGLTSLVLLWRFRTPEPLLIAVAAVAGIALRGGV